MNGYFKPPRRKLGVVTLGLTCVFAAGWVRSLGGEEHVFCPVGKSTYYTLASDKGVINWARSDTSESTWVPSHAGWFRKPYDLVTRVIIETDEMMNANPWDREWEWSGSGVYDASFDSPPFRVRAWRTTYWSIVIPLTLLSAYLLPSKPRSKTTSPEIDRV